MAKPDSDHELFQLTAARDEEAFGALYHRYQGRIFRFALLMSGSRAIADDVTQEVFLALLSGAHRFDPARGPLATYLYGVARNQVLRVLARNRLYAPLEDEPDDEGSAPAHQLAAANDQLGELARSEILIATRQAVLALPTHYREVIVLCDFHEMSHAEAALALNCAVGTVSSRLNRARRLLAEKLRTGGKVDAASLNIDPKGCLV